MSHCACLSHVDQVHLVVRPHPLSAGDPERPGWCRPETFPALCDWCADLEGISMQSRLSRSMNSRAFIQAWASSCVRMACALVGVGTGTGTGTRIGVGIGTGNGTATVTGNGNGNRRGRDGMERGPELQQNLCICACQHLRQHHASPVRIRGGFCPAPDHVGSIPGCLCLPLTCMATCR